MSIFTTTFAFGDDHLEVTVNDNSLNPGTIYSRFSESYPASNLFLKFHELDMELGYHEIMWPNIDYGDASTDREKIEIMVDYYMTQKKRA